MARNKIIDLNDYLFAQLERLSDESLNEEALNKEIRRTASLTDVADRIIKGGDLLLRARIAADNTVSGDKILPAILGPNYGPE